MNTQLLQQARVLDIDEQIELVEAIWDGVVSRGAAPPLTEAQKNGTGPPPRRPSGKSKRCRFLG